MKQYTSLLFVTCIICMCIRATEQPVVAQPVVDLSESIDADYGFFNDPYLEQELQPVHDLTQMGIATDEIAPDAHAPIVDPSEAFNVDFSYFNDPFAFKQFRDLPIKAKFSGYVSNSTWWDSRQVVGFAESLALLFPRKRKFDIDCNDINARGQFNMTMIETRLRAEFYGPKILGADTFAYIESDFVGEALVINRMRLRNAFLQFTWEKAKVLLGEFWSPLFIVKTFPLTVAFDGGVPIELFARNPQIRITANINRHELIFTALSQLNFVSNGPIGLSSTYMRNSRMPELIARYAYEREHIYAGAGLGMLRLKPRLESNKGFKVNESINSMRAFAFSTIKFEPLEVRSSIAYVQNANDSVGISGFAVSSVNPTTDERTYTNTNSLNCWLDININKAIEPGLFVGITKNLGANRNIIQCIVDPKTGEQERTIYALYGDAEQLDTVFKIAPRARFHILPVDFAFELQYIRAGFGCIDRRGKVKNVDPVADTRLLMTAYYYF